MNFSSQPGSAETAYRPWVTKEISRIADRLRESAIARHGAFVWSPRGEGKDSTAAPPMLGPHLYDGSSGIALFLAAYSFVRREPWARDLALGAAAPLRAKISQLAADPERARKLSLAIGGFIGLGSFIYTVVCLARWLEEPGLLSSAYEAASLITQERIDRDDQMDVMAGCAGSLLALLALERAIAASRLDSAKLLGLACACGEHLLARRVPYCGGPRAWPGIDHPPLSGFAHGASGIAYALLRLYQRTGRKDFHDAAIEGFAYERSLYDVRAKNWLDPRFGRLLEQSAWCHGAPGMALSRAAGLAAADTAAVREEIEEALAITCALPEYPVDYLCCGNLGRVEILWITGQLLRRPSLIAESWRLAERVLERAAVRDFALAPTMDRSNRRTEREFQPSFFLGLAGIGYVLLRLGHPDHLPCVLLLE